MRRVSYEEYRDKVRDVYSGPQGALLAACSVISLHTPFGEKLLASGSSIWPAPARFWTSAAEPGRSPATC